MNRFIYKYEIPLGDDVSVSLPGGGEQILSCAMQGEKLMLWALVDVDQPFRPRKFKIKGTGHDCDDLSGYQYLGTVPMLGGAFIWHIFYRTDVETSV